MVTINATIQNINIGSPSLCNRPVKCSGTYLAINTTERINKNGTIHLLFRYGTLNFDSGLFGCDCKTNTPPQTSTNANNVPMLVNAITTSRLRNKAGMPTSAPVNKVEKEGVLYFGWIFANTFGNKPSRLMLIQILG